MAANGFIELLRLSKRGNKQYASTQNEVSRWSGIAFEMLGQYFVAPLGEISEVIYPPKYTLFQILRHGYVAWQIFVGDCFLFLI